MSRYRGVGLVAVAVLVPCGLAAETPVIEHQKIKCIVAEKYPRMDASFTPEEVGQARVFFKPEGIPTWYYVKMTRAPKGYEGVLPKPKRQMVGKKLIYYLEATGKDMEQGTTEETDPRIVASKDDCGNDPMAAWSAKPPVGVFPSVPAGFSAGAAVGPVAGVAAGVAAAGGVTVLATRGDKTPPAREPVPVPSPSPTPTPPPVPPSPPPTEALDVACQAEPNAGGSPLTVKFRGFATGGTGVYDFLWAFGDGETSTQPNPSHTYASPGSYTAVLTVTSGGQTRSCDKRITVEKPCAAIGGPTTAITSPGPSRTPLSGTVTVEASASGPAGIARVQFFAGSTLIGTDDTAPYAVSWRTPAGCGSIDLTSRAIDNCLKEASSSPVGVAFDNDDAGPTIQNVNPPEGFVIDMTQTQTLDVSADVTDPAGVTQVVFRADQGASCSEGSPPFLDEQTVTSPPYQANLNVDNANTCCACVVLQVTGTDGCDNATTFTRNGFVDFDGCCVGLAVRKAARSSRSRPAPQEPAPGQSASWVSQLEAPGALGQAVLNKETLVLSATGLSRHTARTRRGENRIEAQLVRGSGQTGVWRFDFSGIEGFEAGSLRVLEGEVALLTDRAVAFRLKGQAGERVSFTFRVQ